VTGFDEIAAARKQRRGVLDEVAGKRLLAAFGVAVPKSLVLQSATEAGEALQALRPPLVLKIMSPDILHKSDAGGVRINLRTPEEVIEAMRVMQKQPAIRSGLIEGFLLEEMAPAGQEMVIGGLRDPQFGPLIMVGLGGIFVEVLADVSFRICPITRFDAEEMLDELRGAPLLKGARGRKPASRAAIVDALLKVGGDKGLLMTHAEDIREADINPLIVSDDAAVAADVRIILT